MMRKIKDEIAGNWDEDCEKETKSWEEEWEKRKIVKSVVRWWNRLKKLTKIVRRDVMLETREQVKKRWVEEIVQSVVRFAMLMMRLAMSWSSDDDLERPAT